MGYISSRDLQPFSVARLLEAWKKAMWRLHFLWWLETKPEVGLSGRPMHEGRNMVAAKRCLENSQWPLRPIGKKKLERRLMVVVQG